VMLPLSRRFRSRAPLTLFVLHDVLGLKFREIGERIHLSTTQVHACYHGRSSVPASRRGAIMSLLLRCREELSPFACEPTVQRAIAAIDEASHEVQSHSDGRRQ